VLAEAAAVVCAYQPSARAELEARLPGWRDAAVIGGLGIGLDDAEYVGGVLWYGLTHRGGQGNPEEQKRAITDRLVRWATRDGGTPPGPQPRSAPSWPGGGRTGKDWSPRTGSRAAD